MDVTRRYTCGTARLSGGGQMMTEYSFVNLTRYVRKLTLLVLWHYTGS